jgi:hypothetical protein
VPVKMSIGLRLSGEAAVRVPTLGATLSSLGFAWLRVVQFAAAASRPQHEQMTRPNARAAASVSCTIGM